MPISYSDALATDRDKVRFYIQDTTVDSGPKPSGVNFTDDELDGLITTEGGWRKAVAAAYEVLAGLWGQYTDIRVGPRQQSHSQVSARYSQMAKQWRRDYGLALSGAGSRAVTRVDGYSDDIASDEV